MGVVIASPAELLEDARFLLFWGSEHALCAWEDEPWYAERYPDGAPCDEEDCWSCAVERFLGDWTPDDGSTVRRSQDADG